MGSIFSLDDLIMVCKERPLIIYGAGYVAKRFYVALDKLGLSENVVCFCITHGSSGMMMSKNVYSISHLLETSLIPENTLFCVATHEVVKDSIICLLNDKGIHNYVWIYPYLFELLFGEPINRNVMLETKKILAVSLEHSYCEVRNFLAIEYYFGKNDNGFELYRQAVSLTGSKEIAEKRLLGFTTLIKNVSEKKFDVDAKLKVCQNGVIFDGTHRSTVALYFGVKECKCDVFPNSALAVHSKEAWLTEDVLKANFDDRIVALFKETKSRLLEEYCS